MCWDQRHDRYAQVAQTLLVLRMAWRKQEAAVLENAVVVAFVDVADMAVAHLMVGESHSLPHFRFAVLLPVLLVKMVVSKCGNVLVEEGRACGGHLSDVLER